MATKKSTGTPAKKSAKAGSSDTEIPKPAATKAAPAKTAAKSAAKKSAEYIGETEKSSKKSASHDEIARHAHGLWEKHGRQHGSHVDHWLHAEKELNDKQE